MCDIGSLPTKRSAAAIQKMSATENDNSAYQSTVNTFESAINNCMNSGPLKEIGEKQQRILNIQGGIKTAKNDLDIARTRHEAVLGAEKKVSDYQGVSAQLGGFKPIREGSVAVLIGLGIFLIFLALYVVGMMQGGGAAAAATSAFNTYGMGAGLFAGFNKRSFLYGVGAVAVVVGTLAYFGVYGKRLY